MRVGFGRLLDEGVLGRDVLGRDELGWDEVAWDEVGDDDSGVTVPPDEHPASTTAAVASTTRRAFTQPL